MHYLPSSMVRPGMYSKFLIFLSALCVLAPLGAAALPEIPAPPAGHSQLEEATRLMLTREETPDQVIRLIDSAERQFRRISDGGERSYWTARVELARATRYNQLGEKRAAERAAQRGLDEIEAALEGGDFSEGLRVLSDLHAQMMMAKGMFYMIRNGNAARDAAMEALEREPRNIKAQITVAGFLLNAPPMAGGDTAQGRMVLERALAQEPASANDRFLILGWLAQASHAMDDLDAAEQYFAEALAIYPESEWLAEIGDSILD
jgi:tetratricopeptide (TPR) repeat protein